MKRRLLWIWGMTPISEAKKDAAADSAEVCVGEQSTDCFPSIRKAAPLLTGFRAAHHCLQLHFLLDTAPLKQARALAVTPCFLDRKPLLGGIHDGGGQAAAGLGWCSQRGAPALCVNQPAKNRSSCAPCEMHQQAPAQHSAHPAQPDPTMTLTLPRTSVHQNTGTLSPPSTALTMSTEKSPSPNSWGLLSPPTLNNKVLG